MVPVYGLGNGRRASVGEILMRKTTGFDSASRMAVCSIVAVTAFGSAHAQVVEEVVVTGYRAENAKAIQVKRDASAIVESIVADDVQSLPDISLAESLRRVAGVSAEERNGDAKYVVVRGLAKEYNATTIDGARLAGTDPDTQTVQLSLIPSTLARRVDIRKSFTAEMDGDVVGGAINVITRSAFDSAKPYLAIHARAGTYENNEAVGRKADLSSDVNATFAGQFVNGRLGLVLSATHRETDTFTFFPGVFANAWDFYSDDLKITSPNAYALGVNPNKPVPSGIRQSVYTGEQRRDGFYGKLEARPNDVLRLSLSAFRFKESELEDRDDHYLYRTPAQGLSNITETTGKVDRARLHVGNDYRTYTNITSNVTSAGSYDFGEGRKLAGQVNVSKGSQANPQSEFRFQTDYLPGNAYIYDYSGDYPIFTLVNPATYTTPAQAPLQHLRFYNYKNAEFVRNADAYYEDHFQRRDDGFGWRIGASASNTVRKRDYDHTEYQRATGMNLFLDQFDRDVTYTPRTQQLVGQTLYLVDRDALLALLQSSPASFRVASVPRLQALSNDFRIQEDVAAGFAAGSYRSGPLNITGGLRYERTKIKSAGYQSLTAVGTTTYPYIEQDRSYDHWLPSVQVDYTLSPTLKVRAGVSKTMGRPTYAQLRVNGTRSVDATRNTVTLSSGNPDLLAREATNYDLSLEYYPQRFDGFASIGLFRKDIANEIFTAVESSTEVIGGATFNVTATRPTNALDSKLNGVEASMLLNDLAFVTPWLTNFGVKANVSFIKADASVLMTNSVARKLYGLRAQPREIGNLEVFYERSGLDLRAVYNHRGRYINAINTTRKFNDQFSNARDVIDLKAKYAINKHMNVFAEARNITDFAQDETWDQDFNRIIYTRDDGRSYWMGFSYRY